MSGDVEPLIVFIHHPAKIDIEAIRAEPKDSPRPVELSVLPFKESIKQRRARQTPPVPSSLLAALPEPGDELLGAWRRAEVLLTLDLPFERLADMPRLRWVTEGEPARAALRLLVTHAFDPWRHRLDEILESLSFQMSPDVRNEECDQTIVVGSGGIEE